MGGLGRRGMDMDQGESGRDGGDGRGAAGSGARGVGVLRKNGSADWTDQGVGTAVVQEVGVHAAGRGTARDQGGDPRIGEGAGTDSGRPS